METVQLGYLVTRENGLDTANDWNDVLSGNTIMIFKPIIILIKVVKSRESRWPGSSIISLSLRSSVIRLNQLYQLTLLCRHIDECTSAVSVDVEAILYNHSRELGITLFTVSHRQTLFKFHEYLLKFDGEVYFVLRRIATET